MLHPLYEIEHGPADRAAPPLPPWRIEQGADGSSSAAPPSPADLPLPHAANPRISTDPRDSIWRRWCARPSFLTSVVVGGGRPAVALDAAPTSPTRGGQRSKGATTEERESTTADRARRRREVEEALTHTLVK
jgi:hypothetical protein